jgi:hypothetical protein
MTVSPSKSIQGTEKVIAQLLILNFFKFLNIIGQLSKIPVQLLTVFS